MSVVWRHPTHALKPHEWGAQPSSIYLVVGVGVCGVLGFAFDLVDDVGGAAGGVVRGGFRAVFGLVCCDFGSVRCIVADGLRSADGFVIRGLGAFVGLVSSYLRSVFGVVGRGLRAVDGLVIDLFGAVGGVVCCDLGSVFGIARCSFGGICERLGGVCENIERSSTPTGDDPRN